MFSPASHRRQQRLVISVPAVAMVAALAACGGATEDQTPAAALADCTVPADSIIGYSLDRFIRTREPQPYRFLVPVSADSAVPQSAQFALNTLNRAMFIWPPDAARQQQQIANIRAQGPLPTIVLYYHGSVDLPDGRKSTSFSGVYHDVRNSGVTIARTEVFFDCSAAEGSRYRAGDEPPPADSASPAQPADAAAGAGKAGGGN